MSAISLLSDDSNGSFSHWMSIVYYLYVAIFQVLFFTVAAVICKKMYREIRGEPKQEHNYIDTFKLAQFVFVLSFLISRNIFIFLTKVHGFKCYFNAMLSISLFFFYFFELINNSCWLNVMIHIRHSKWDSHEGIRQIKKKEI